MASEQKTVRVRIAVAVNEYGEWSCRGSNVSSDDEGAAMRRAMRDVGGVGQFWLTAELPVPTPLEVPATIEQERGNGE